MGSDEPAITCVTTGIIDAAQHIVLSVWSNSRGATTFWRFQPLTGELAALEVQLERPVAHMQFISATPVPAGVSNSQPLSPFPQCVIAVSDRDLCVIPWAEDNDVTGANEEGDRPHVAHRRLLKTSGRVTALAAHLSPAHRALILMTGTVTGHVDVWRLATPLESEALEIELISELYAPIKNVPVNLLQFDLPSNLKERGILILTQSEIEQESWRDLTKPSIAVISLDEQLDSKSIDFQTDLCDEDLGEILAMKEFKDGHTRRIALVTNRYDTNGKPTTVISIVTLHANAPTVTHKPLSTAVFPSADIEFYCGGSSCDVICPERIVSCAGMLIRKPQPSDNSSRYLRFAGKIGARLGPTCNHPERADVARHMRARFDGELFIDRLLRDVGVREPSLRYPSQSAEDWLNLVKEVAVADVESCDKDRVSLYLAHDGNTGENARFVREQLVSPSDTHEIAGYWALDHGKFEEGVRQLSLAKKIKSAMVTKVLKALVANGRHAEAMRYIQATRPELRTEEDKCIRMALHLKQQDIYEALNFQRSYRRSSLGDRLWQQLLDFVFQDKPESSAAAKAFLLLPLTANEETRLASYCQSHGSRPALQFIMTYLIQRGRLSDALPYFRQLQQVEARGRNSRAVSVDASLNAAKHTNFEMVLPYVFRFGDQDPCTSSSVPPMPLSANANIRVSALNNVEAQSALLTAVHRAIHSTGGTPPTRERTESVDLENTFEIISKDHASLDVTAIFSDHEAPSELDDGELITPPESDIGDSGPPSPTPPGRSSPGDDASLGRFDMLGNDVSRRFPEHAAATADLISSRPGSILQLYPHPTSPPAASRPRPPSLYPSVPAALPPTVSDIDPFRRSFASPEMVMKALNDREEQVERVKSPVGPSVPHAPPMKSMSPFERVQEPLTPNTERPKRRVRHRSPSPPGRKSTNMPSSLQSRLASVAREQAAAVPPTPARRSGRIAAKKQAHDSSDDDEPIPPPTTRKRAKLAIDEPTVLADDHDGEEEVQQEDHNRAAAQKTPRRANMAATSAAPRSTRRRTALSASTSAAPLEVENAPPPAAIPATPKPRVAAKTKLKTPAPSGLRERNALPARTTRTASKKAPAPPTPAKDEPMSLADLDASPIPRRPAARAAKAAESSSKAAAAAKKAPATVTLSRTVLTRRMAKKLEEEGHL
ncbi:Protein ELYS [Geranomyces michiganensis]|nr:Protein ELYS [Geranomyces michiganensis]